MSEETINGDGEFPHAAPAPADAVEPLTSGPRQVQSVSRAISLVAAVADHGAGMTLTELAREANLSLSTTYRLVQTLCASEVLCRDPNDEHFIPGPFLLRLARSSLAQGGVQEASEILDSVAKRTRETATLGIRDGDGVVIIMAAESPELLRFDRRPGMRLALHASAIGRALLAFGEREITEAVAELVPLSPVTTKTRTEPQILINELRATTYRRWTLSDEEHDEAIRSIAAPIVGFDGVAHAAVGLEGPISRMYAQELEQQAAILVEAAVSLRHLPLAMASMGAAAMRGPHHGAGM